MIFPRFFRVEPQAVLLCSGSTRFAREFSVSGSLCLGVSRGPFQCVLTVTVSTSDSTRFFQKKKFEPPRDFPSNKIGLSRFNSIIRSRPCQPSRGFCDQFLSLSLAVRGVSDVVYAPVSGNSSTRGWFGILGGTHEKDCGLFMSRLKIVSGLPYKIVIESWNIHASSSSQEALLWKAAARGLKEKRERSQSVPLTLPASYSLFLI